MTIYICKLGFVCMCCYYYYIGICYYLMFLMQMIYILFYIGTSTFIFLYFRIYYLFLIIVFVFYVTLFAYVLSLLYFYSRYYCNIFFLYLKVCKCNLLLFENYLILKLLFHNLTLFMCSFFQVRQCLLYGWHLFQGGGTC